jgi:site-specific recombinase XerD
LPSDLDNEIEAFVAYNKLERRLQARTAIEYARVLRDFADFLNDGTLPGSVAKLKRAKIGDIRRFLVSKESKAPEGKKWALASYYRYLRANGERDDNPAIEISFETRKREPITVLTREEVRRLLEAPHSREAVRDKAILHFFYSGPKRKEVGEVLVSGFDIGKQQIEVNGRVIPLRREAAEAIADYLKVRRDCDDDALFVSSRGTAVKERQAWVILKECAAETGQPPNTAFERLRKSYTVHALQDGDTVLDVLNARGSDNPKSIYEEIKIAYGDSRNAPNLFGEGVTDETFDALDMRKIKEAWYEVTALLGSKPEGALRETLVLIDSVAEKILKAHGVEFSRQDNSGWKCKKALSLLLPPAEQENEFFKAFAKSAASIVDNIGQYRGLRSDAHAAAGERAVKRYEAEYAANLARATVAFMVQCYRVKTASNESHMPRESTRKRKATVSFTLLQAQVLSTVLRNAIKRPGHDSEKSLRRLLKILQRQQREGNVRIRLGFSTAEAQNLLLIAQRLSTSSRKSRLALGQVQGKLARIIGPRTAKGNANQTPSGAQRDPKPSTTPTSVRDWRS